MKTSHRLTLLPREGLGFREAYQDFLKFVKPFPFGQFTPRFWGWAGGTGTSDGVLARNLKENSQRSERSAQQAMPVTT
jgi:hypothetical protein